MKSFKKLLLLLVLSLYIPSAFACACSGDDDQQTLEQQQQQTIMQGQAPSLNGDNNASDITNIDSGDASTGAY